MISYTDYRNRWGKLTKNTTTSGLETGDLLINDSLRYLTGKFYFNERSYTTVTQAQQQFYNLPPQVKNLINVTVNIGSVLWTPKFAPNREYWDALNVITFYQDFPSFFYVFDGQMGLFPIPASDDNTITMNYKIRLRDLSQADYSTGTVTVTNNSATVTGAGGATFIPDMAGRWIRVTAPSGDEQWYEIGAYVNSTTLTLLNPYTGVTTSGASYVIGEMPLLAEDYQDLALYRALWVYFNSIVPSPAQAKMYKELYDVGYEMLNAEYGQKTTNVALVDTDAPVYNPNLFVTSLTQT